MDSFIDISQVADATKSPAPSITIHEGRGYGFVDFTGSKYSFTPSVYVYQESNGIWSTSSGSYPKIEFVIDNVNQYWFYHSGYNINQDSYTYTQNNVRQYNYSRFTLDTNTHQLTCTAYASMSIYNSSNISDGWYYGSIDGIRWPIFLIYQKYQT